MNNSRPVACDVYDGVFFVLYFFPRGVLDEILNLIESVSEVFSSYSTKGKLIRESLFKCIRSYQSEIGCY